MLLAGAGMLLKTLLALQSARTGFDLHNVLALNVPVISYGRTPDQVQGFYREAMRQIVALPGVDRVAVGTVVPWRDAGLFGPGFQFTADGHVRASGEEDPRAQFRTVSPEFFAALGVPIISGRDFNDADRKDTEKVVIVSHSVAQRMFPNQDAVGHHFMWSDPVMKFIDVSTEPRRIIGVAIDMDDERVVPGPAMTIYHPFEQEMGGGRLFVHTHSDPYALVTPITRIVRDMSVDQPVERAATLEDVRAEVLTPDRLNALVFGGFAAVALAIAVVGVAGVLVFSVSGRTREFGIRLALGAQPQNLLKGVIAEGAVMAAGGIVAGGILGYVMARVASSYILDIRMPDLVPVVASAGVLLAAAVVASFLPAARAARIDVMQALRSE
jgi:putative ABC transport system permease protein